MQSKEKKRPGPPRHRSSARFPNLSRKTVSWVSPVEIRFQWSPSQPPVWKPDLREIELPMNRISRLVLIAALLVLLLPGPALAYIGPGAGLRAGGVVFRSVRRVLFRYCAGIHLAGSLALACSIRSAQPGKVAASRRVVVLGLDGLDHGLTEKMLAEGKLPNLAGCASKVASNRWAARCRPFRRSPGLRFKPASIRASTTSSIS